MTLALLEPLLFLAAAFAATAGLLILQLGLQRVFAVAPRLKPVQAGLAQDTSLTVVIPAFNEAHNIEACVRSVLASAPPCQDWSLLVVDDDSTDATVEKALDAGSDVQRFRLIQAGPRPTDERWVGKNWACSKAVEQVSSDYCCSSMLPTQARCAATGSSSGAGGGRRFVSLAPRLSCDAWRTDVQPIMASLLGLGFPILETNDPASPVAFAAGPFMLFKTSTYTRIGGHRARAGEVVEDLALARAIKAGGHRLRYLLGLDAVDLRMYADLAALWEGWTKNWFLGLDRDPTKALGAALVVMLMFALPWLLLPASLVLLWLQPELSIAWWCLMALSMLAILQHLLLRLWTRSNFDVPLRYWWLMGVGGLLVGAIGPVSIWRTRTGRGWTWKGRALN